MITLHPLLATGAATAAFGLTAVLALSPVAAPSATERLDAYADANAQSLQVSADVAPADTRRDAYGATDGIDTLVAAGTNHDWARLVLLFGEWPVTDSSVTAITRWMRQENGPDNWYNRNNPLNNGWGSLTGDFLGGYETLEDAARMAADALHENPGYAGIEEELSRGDSTSDLEKAIWDSPWATGHYDNGGHWSTADVPRIEAPDDAWGG